MVRTLAAVITDQELVFAELLAAQRELETLSRAGRELGLVDGQESDADAVMSRLHTAQHQLDALTAEGLQAALNPHGA